jgi:translation initiation factor 2 alpha subunit (eIF-2alpha)
MGKRSGDAIDLDIHWAKDVNGDREAQMKIEKIGADGMRLTTVDTDPKTGKSVLTSQIDLSRL